MSDSKSPEGLCCKHATGEPGPKGPSGEIDASQIVNVDKIININELKENSVITLTFTEVTPLIISIIEAFGKRYGDQLRKKNVSIILVSPNDKIEVLEEDKMNELGWFRKEEKSRLILP